MIRFTLRDKSPTEDQVYSINWTPYIGGDTLNGVPTAEVLEGTVEAYAISNPDTHTTRFFLRGGVRGEVAKILFHQPAAGSPELDAEVIIGVR